MSHYFLFSASLAYAAEFQVATHENEGALLVVAKTPVNAIEGEVTVPDGVIVSETNDARSIVPFWIKKPELSADGRTIAFAGIIPGGFSGEGVLFRFRGSGLPRLSVNKDKTRSLANDGAATPDPVVLLPAGDLPPQYRMGDASDETAPELDMPEIAVVPTEEGEKEALIFRGRDGESGVARYEVAWSDIEVDPNDPSLAWARAESPLVLPDGAKGKYTYIKAINGAGESRVKVIPPVEGKRGFWLILAILILVVIPAALFFGVRNRTMKVRLALGGHDTTRNEQ